MKSLRSVEPIPRRDRTSKRLGNKLIHGTCRATFTVRMIPASAPNRVNCTCKESIRATYFGVKATSRRVLSWVSLVQDRADAVCECLPEDRSVKMVLMLISLAYSIKVERMRRKKKRRKVMFIFIFPQSTSCVSYLSIQGVV